MPPDWSAPAKIAGGGTRSLAVGVRDRRRRHVGDAGAERRCQLPRLIFRQRIERRAPAAERRECPELCERRLFDDRPLLKSAASVAPDAQDGRRLETGAARDSREGEHELFGRASMSHRHRMP
ncbi:MAG: hypothetical protein AUI11_09865 [Acidobacteria bacterium 13_2_20CM_2_66_4]|nr:MAG: hypothetical protein AUI11_09865 [Acidobacteria bacterium 13_2_20CM_2_66_4]